MSDLMTVSEVGEKLRVDETTVRRWIKNGALPAVTLPHMGKRQAYRVRSTDFAAILGGPDTAKEAAREMGSF